MRIWDKFQNQKLNVKFTCLIIIFMIVPIGIFTALLFIFLKQNVVHENINDMEYMMHRNEDTIQTGIDAINMSTQFFLSDEKMCSILNRCSAKEPVSTQEWLDFKQQNVSALERMVNSNPLLYGVRVYASGSHVQEMMPILYKYSRIKRQSWSADGTWEGWKFDYQDNIFSAYALNQNQKIISLVTPVTDRINGQTGLIEAAMTMENMFPALYEDVADEWGFFCTATGNVHVGTNAKQVPDALLKELASGSSAKKDMETSYVGTQGKYLIVSYLPIPEMSGTFVCVKDITDGILRADFIRNIVLIVLLIFTALLACVVNWIVRRMLRQFYEILTSIREVQAGDLHVVVKNCGQDEMGELGTQINKMLARIRQLMDDNLKREMLIKNSEIRALQNQINAHFIYNVLESIKMMAEIDEKYEISDAVTALGKLLRYSMKWASGNVRIEQEIEYIRNYIALMNLRFDYEIILCINLSDDMLMQQIPKMSLQPIVENAIYHGIEQLAEDTSIYIKGVRDGADCVIEITDSGCGMSQEEVERLEKKIAGKIDSNGGSGNGIGLKNVQDRLHIAFGGQYGIKVASKEGCYTKVMVRIPMQRTEKEQGVIYENSTDCGR